MTREAEYARFRRLIAELEAGGVTLYKIASVMGKHYSVVRNWKSTGRLDSFDAKALEAIHRDHFHPMACMLRPSLVQVCTVSTTPPPA